MPNKLLSLMESSLKVERFSYGRTMLEDWHLPNYYTIREIFGVNQYVDGAITYEVKDVGKKYVSDGSAIILPMGIPMKGVNHNPNSTIAVWFSIHYSIMDTMDPIEFLKMPYVLDKSIGRKVGEISKKIFENEVVKDINILQYICRRHELAMKLFDIVLSVSVIDENALENLYKIERIQPVMLYIKKNLARALNTHELASVLSISEPRFFELFKHSMGMSPGRYIQQLRMKKAQELLMDSDLKIYEVAVQVGYDDQFHFSRLFKRHFGISPDLFRKQF